MKRRTLLAALAVATLYPPAPAGAQAVERVQFRPGTSSADIRGAIQGYQYRDYVIGARAGQTMSVNLSTRHTATYFNVLPPGSANEAIFRGEVAGSNYSGRLAQNGDYRVRVYMMRSAARRNERAAFTLTVSVTGQGAGAGRPPAAGGPGARPVDVSDLKGMDGVRSFDVMIARGFRNVDSITTGNTIYGIYFHPRTRQCVQVATANSRVVDARDIYQHPKCR